MRSPFLSAWRAALGVFLRGARECFQVYPALVSKTHNELENMEKIVKYAPLMEFDVWRGEEIGRRL